MTRTQSRLSKIYERLLLREVSGATRYTNVKALYGDRKWVSDLDIVNELDGHTGCVNALSWSKSGKFLASGSDDTNLHIHELNGDSTGDAFRLATSVHTGHTANIFSVKFMPHSDDRTLVTAAGDCQIRVFDIEYSGVSSNTFETGSSRTRAGGLLRQGTQYLTDLDTRCRVYKSHSDRVKRIVTESSPHLFLSCSEDGEVRQWDLRQPSSSYPRARNGGWGSATQDQDTGVSPPLISYKRYQLDLNTISCSPSQPHYIALGGAHLHCFLHDRRMMGRDKLAERGQKLNPSKDREHDDDLMREATQCVRRFAPHGEKRVKRNANGHITACKISDARPNEMIASWSGDWIYGFDLMKSPDAKEESKKTGSFASQSLNGIAKESRHRKRKRTQGGSELSLEGVRRTESRLRRQGPAARQSDDEDVEDDLALQVRYGNGQTENIPLRHGLEGFGPRTEAPLTESERTSLHVANLSVKVKKHIFVLNDQKPINENDPTGHATSFTSTLGFAAAILDEMDEIIRSWRYPVDPDAADVAYQTTVRRHRESARRFVQASGTIARLLGGRLRTAGMGQHPMFTSFIQIEPAPNESKILDESEQFYYDFIKAIIAWLDSGPGAIVEQFHGHGNKVRLPVPANASIEAIDEVVIPYLLRLASDRPVPNVDASRYEVDEHRSLFSSEKAAVIAFSKALKIPFEDLSGIPDGSDLDDGSVRPSTQGRKTAFKFWGLKVARGLLFGAAEGISHSFIDRAFGGSGHSPARIRREEKDLDIRLGFAEPKDDNSADEEDNAPRMSLRHTSQSYPTSDLERELEEEEEESDTDIKNDSSESSESDSDLDSEGEQIGPYVFRQTLPHRSNKPAADTPIISHNRHYAGHCNVSTVKDVNFYGLNDEYVISGSDCGNLFIWDSESMELLNILQGDGEVVNVIQGHPYEPMLAVSGIDHTIKIFSGDARARRNARRGIGVRRADDSTFSSIRRGMRRRPQSTEVPNDEDLHISSPNDNDSEDGSDAPPSAHGLASRRRIREEYRIRSENDDARQGGAREAIITRGMLAQLATQIQAGNVRFGVRPGEEVVNMEDVFGALGGAIGMPLVIGENGPVGGEEAVGGQDCNVM